MSEEMKKRVMASLEKHHAKLWKQQQKAPRTQPNQTPELSAQCEVLNYLESIGWLMSEVDSKAVYSEKLGTYGAGNATVGTSDLCGCTDQGLGAFVEMKAPGKRSTLKSHQRIFLVERINAGAFACCSDSVKHIHQLLCRWNHAHSLVEKKALLLQDLPPEKVDASFDPEFGF
jgi:hypothetical protein